MKSRHTLQHGCTLKTRHSEKEAKHERPPVVWFHLYEMSRRGSSVDTESRFVTAWGRGMWMRIRGTGVLWGVENALKLTNALHWIL